MGPLLGKAISNFILDYASVCWYPHQMDSGQATNVVKLSEARLLAIDVLLARARKSANVASMQHVTSISTSDRQVCGYSHIY